MWIVARVWIFHTWTIHGGRYHVVRGQNVTLNWYTTLGVDRSRGGGFEEGLDRDKKPEDKGFKLCAPSMPPRSTSGLYMLYRNCLKESPV